MEGRATSARPEMEVDNFIQKIPTNAAFAAAVQQIRLRSIARAMPATEGTVKGVPVGQFIIECRYKEKAPEKK